LKEYISLLQTVSLFKGIEASELEVLLSCIGAKAVSVKRGGIILPAGEKPKFVGIVITGLVHIVQEDYDGNRTLISAATPGDLFAEAICCAGIAESPVTVLANADTKILSIYFSNILQTCPHSCSFHTQLIGNMLGIIANKALMLQDRMEIVGIKSVRGKVLRYLETLSAKQGRRVTIPFNREELAEFLFVERSALSHELSRMRDDGLIEYRKNVFTLCK